MHKKGIMAHLSMHGVLEGLEFQPHGGAYLTLPMDHGTLAELAQLGKKRGESNPAAWAAAFFGDSSERGDSLVWMIRNTERLMATALVKDDARRSSWQSFCARSTPPRKCGLTTLKAMCASLRPLLRSLLHVVG